MKIYLEIKNQYQTYERTQFIKDKNIYYFQDANSFFNLNRLLQFNPEQFLDFQVASNKIPTTKLNIRNVSENQVLFRIIPESNSIKISKSYGILYNQEQTRISIYLNISKKRIEDIYQKKIIVEYVQYLGTENWEPTDFMNRSKGVQFQKHELEVVINNIGSAASFVTQESQEFEQKIKSSQLYQNQNLTDIDFTKLDYQSFCEENQKNFEIQEEYVENQNILKQLNSEERKAKQENQFILALNNNKLSQFSEIKGTDMIHSFKPQSLGQNNNNLELQNGQNSSRQYNQNPMLNSLNMQVSESEFQTGNFGSHGIKADNFQEMINSQKQLQIKEKLMQENEQKNKQALIQYARNEEQLANSSREEEKHNNQVSSQSKEKYNYFSQINNKNIRENPQIVFNQQQNYNQNNNNNNNRHKSNSLTDINQFIQNNSELIKDSFSKSTLIQDEHKHQQNKQLHNLNVNKNQEQNFNLQLNQKNNFPTSQKTINNKTNQKIISGNQSHSEKYAVIGNEIGPDESNNNLMQFDHYQSENSENVLSDNLSEYQEKRERKNSENLSIQQSEHLDEDIANIPYSQREITEKNKIDSRDNQHSANRQSYQNLNSDQKNTSNSSFEYQSIHYGSVNQFKEQNSGYDNTSISQNYASFQQEQLNSSRQQNVPNSQGLIQNQKLQLENKLNEFSVIGEEQSHQDKESEQQIQSNTSKNGTAQLLSHDIMFDQQFNYEKQNKKPSQFSSLQDVERNSLQSINSQQMSHLGRQSRQTLGAEGIHKFQNSQINEEINNYQIFGMLDPLKKSNLESNNQIGSNIKLETPKRNSILEIQCQINKRQFSQDQNDAFDTDSQKAGYWKEKYEIAAKKESQYKKSIEEQKQTLQFLKSDINKLEFLHRMEKPINPTPSEKVEINQAKFQTWHLIFLAIASAIFGFMMKKLTL